MLSFWEKTSIKGTFWEKREIESSQLALHFIIHVLFFCTTEHLLINLIQVSMIDFTLIIQSLHELCI